MSMRIPACLLLFIAVAAVKSSVAQVAGQNAETTKEPLWEYRVIVLDPNECMSQTAMSNVLNTNGRRGWELISLHAGPPQSSGVAEGSVAMRADLPNGRQDLYPQLVGSYQGSISLKLPQAQAGACQLVFKRKAEGGK